MIRMKIIYWILLVALVLGCGQGKLSQAPPSKLPEKQTFVLKKEQTSKASILVKKKTEVRDNSVKSKVEENGKLLYSIRETKELHKPYPDSELHYYKIRQHIHFNDGRAFNFDDGERILYQGKSKIITTKYISNKTILSKYQLNNDTLLLNNQSELFDDQSVVDITNSDVPNFLTIEARETISRKYMLFSGNLEKKLEYIPFNFGFINGFSSTFGDTIIIITANFQKKGLYKIALINAKLGVIENHTIIDLREESLFNLYVSEAGILITSKTKARSFKAYLFDYKFNEIWQKNINRLFAPDQISFLPEKKLFYWKGFPSVLCISGLQGTRYEEIDLVQKYLSDEEINTLNLLENNGIGIQKIIPLKKNFVMVAIAQKSSGLEDIWHNLVIYILDDNDVIQTIKIPGESSTLGIFKNENNTINIHFGNKEHYYEIL